MQGLPKIGDVLDGTYRIESELGRGGFGAVYLARQMSMDREVALKILVAHAMKVDEMIRRFRREVMAIRNLGHPNTIRVYDFRDRSDGMLYYVMEHIKGPTLKEVIKEGAMPPARVHRILRQVLKSLAEAHDFGIVHRDLKPANIMLAQMHGETDFVKVLDFGIAKIMDGDDDEERDQITSAGVLVGTLNYMSPEQIAGGQITGASDLYALALIGIEMLSGKSVFEGTGRWEILHKQISDEPVEIPQIVLDSPLGPVFRKALQKRPQQRYPRAEEMLAALDAIGPLSLAPLVEGESTEAEVDEVPVSRSGPISMSTPISHSGPITGARALRESAPPGSAALPAAPQEPPAAEALEQVLVGTSDAFADEKTQVTGVSPAAVPVSEKPAAEAADPVRISASSDPTGRQANAPARRGGKGTVVIAGAALVCVAIAATVAVVAFSSGSEVTSADDKAPTEMTAGVAAPPVPREKPVHVELPPLPPQEPAAPIVESKLIKLRTGETRAQLFDGDRLIGTTPIRFEVSLARDYTLKAEGFQEATIELSNASEATVDVELVPVGGKAPARPKTQPVESQQVESQTSKDQPPTDQPPTNQPPKDQPPKSQPPKDQAEPKDSLDWVPIKPAAKPKSEPEVPLF